MLAKTIVKIQDSISFVHGRPLHERKALFFASFLVIGTIVFSIWANHMYSRFGVAFINQEEGLSAASRGISEGEGLITGKSSQAVSYEAGSNELGGPFVVFRENVSLLKEETVKLWSAVSSELQGITRLTMPELTPPEEPIAVGASPGAGRLGEDKLPPVTNHLPDDDLSSLLREPPVSITSPSSGVASQALESVVVIADTDAESKASQDAFISDDLAHIELQHASEMPGSDVSRRASVVFVEKSEQDFAYEPVEASYAITAHESKRIFNLASILANNFFIISQAMGDFYEYLTQ